MEKSWLIGLSTSQKIAVLERVTRVTELRYPIEERLHQECPAFEKLSQTRRQQSGERNPTSLESILLLKYHGTLREKKSQMCKDASATFAQIKQHKNNERTLTALKLKSFRPPKYLLIYEISDKPWERGEIRILLKYLGLAKETDSGNKRKLQKLRNLERERRNGINTQSERVEKIAEELQKKKKNSTTPNVLSEREACAILEWNRVRRRLQKDEAHPWDPQPLANNVDTQLKVPISDGQFLLTSKSRSSHLLNANENPENRQAPNKQKQFRGILLAKVREDLTSENEISGIFIGQHQAGNSISTKLEQDSGIHLAIFINTELSDTGFRVVTSKHTETPNKPVMIKLRKFVNFLFVKFKITYIYGKRREQKYLKCQKYDDYNNIIFRRNLRKLNLAISKENYAPHIVKEFSSEQVQIKTVLFIVRTVLFDEMYTLARQTLYISADPAKQNDSYGTLQAIKQQMKMNVDTVTRYVFISGRATYMYKISRAISASKLQAVQTFPPHQRNVPLAALCLLMKRNRMTGPQLIKTRDIATCEFAR
ncbi:hypothetical protein WN51_02544 [Melipona quadrifasciata]|uniref:Uncharacterized protein n=1 Tax=Melipona quadrifasciata TaxID=166423 RepID=A0A0N0BDI8_9HYME|nr:hypothetical protein WN51_02544 [Melipona quadrifasciata]